MKPSPLYPLSCPLPYKPVSIPLTPVSVDLAYFSKLFIIQLNCTASSVSQQGKSNTDKQGNISNKAAREIKLCSGKGREYGKYKDIGFVEVCHAYLRWKVISHLKLCHLIKSRLGRSGERKWGTVIYPRL